jgi:hypothetical protein
MPVLKKVTPRAKITGPGGRRLNIFNLNAIMRDELHRLVGEHQLVAKPPAVKQGASKDRGSAKLAARLMQEIDRITNSLQAMSVDLDE